MSSCGNSNTNYNSYFLGQEDDLDSKQIFNYFDSNYLPLENLPISYFSMNQNEVNKLKSSLDDNSKQLVTQILMKLNEMMENKENNYNNYNILYMTITLVIFFILIIIALLRLIQYHYPLYYIYILIGIIIIILLITSLWFLYVNTSIL